MQWTTVNRLLMCKSAVLSNLCANIMGIEKDLYVITWQVFVV